MLDKERAVVAAAAREGDVAATAVEAEQEEAEVLAREALTAAEAPGRTPAGRGSTRGNRHTRASRTWLPRP